MRKILIIIWIIAWFLVINFFSIKAFYNNYEWNKSYENKNFSWAIDDFKKSNNYIWLYNIWNSNYRLWEQEKENNKKIAFWEKSLKNYKDSMEINYTKSSEENYIFVKKKLEELKKKIKQEQNKNSPVIPFHKGDENKKKWDNTEKNWEKHDSKENSWDKKKVPVPIDKKLNSGTGTWNKKQKWDNLSKNQEQILKQYEEQLKQQQKQNAWEFNKVYEEHNNDPFDNLSDFFWDSFFNNNLLNSWNDKKDW